MSSSSLLPQPIAELTPKSRSRGMVVTGESGTGVSTFLLNQVAADLSKNRRIILFDPWGDLAVQLHKTYSDILVWKVGVKEPSNCCIDLFANGIRKISHDMVSERVMDLMYTLFDPEKSGLIGPRFTHTMRNSIAVLRDVGEASFSNLQRLLTDTSYLTSILPRVVDPGAKAYFTKVLETTSDTSKSDVLEYILPKLSVVMPDSQLGMVLDTSITKPWSEVVKSSTKVIVVDLSALSSQSRTLSVAYSLIVQDLIQTLQTDKSIGEQLSIYIDEVQRIGTLTSQSLSHELRRVDAWYTSTVRDLYTLSSTEVHGYLVGKTLVSFRVSPPDASLLLPYFVSFDQHIKLDTLSDFEIVARIRTDRGVVCAKSANSTTG